MSDDPVSLQSRQYIKDHKRELCVKFADPAYYLPLANPSAYFMAGSPGAGKTEYSKSFIDILTKGNELHRIVRIDADEIRDFIPMYDHKNAMEIQGAAALGVEKVLDWVLAHNQEFVLDATCANFEKSYDNINRCLSKKRRVGLIYIYQDPLIAWDFTKKREAVEGRRVPKDIFIHSFFNAKENVNRLKKEFGKDIELTLIIKDFIKGVENTEFNIDNVDGYIKIQYTPEALERSLSN